MATPTPGDLNYGDYLAEILVDSITPKPTPNTALAGHSMAYPPAPLSAMVLAAGAAKTRSRSERSAPVRNPAFREHEGLKELQKQLNSRK